ncbi:MAG: nucleoside 2-deoxyribosyltransferase [Patescibacteria group bacterium]|nr:nucleoside 2-deoxyribosyltransferase [Patescibacteria group bacterium]
MKFFIASPWKNKEEVEKLSEELKTKGHETYSFLESGENLLTGQPIEAEMKVYWEALANWQNDKRISQIFESEVNGLKACDALILLLPAGDSSHVEAGIAYGLGKKLFLIGAINKPEVVYLMFNKIYMDITSFLSDLPNIFS